MAGSSESCQPWHRQAAILQPVCRSQACRTRPFPVSWELLRLLQAIPLSGKWWLCSSGSLAGGSPHPITTTSLCLKPQGHSPSAAGRSAKRDCSYQIGGMFLHLWLLACWEDGVGRKTTPEKLGRPLCGAGQAVGAAATREHGMWHS